MHFPFLFPKEGVLNSLGRKTSLYPPANVRANSLKLLSQMGVKVDSQKATQ